MATPQIFVNVLCTPVANWQWNMIAVNAGSYFDAEQTSSGSVNADISFDFYAETGTYTLDLVHKASTNRGIYTVQVDEVSVGTVDGYANPAAAAKASITGIVITTTGTHRVTLVMATKNASSTSHFGVINGIVLTRTGA